MPPLPAAPRYSVVVPVFNEEGSLDELHAELTVVLADLVGGYEILYVNDGSTDSSAAHLEALQQGDDHVRVLALPRNRGKSAVYDLGFAGAAGEVLITLDADLQDDPNEIPKLLAALTSADLVVGWKQHRLENEPLKAVPSRVFNGLTGLLFGLRLHDSNCGFRVMRREVAASLELYGDLYRFIPELAFVQGFRVAEAGVNHRRRKHGVSKYGARRFWTGLLDLLTVRFITIFADRPLHFFGTVGLVPFTMGTGLLIYVLASKLGGSTFQTHVAAIIIGVMFLIVGFQCLITGLIGEMLSAQQRRLRADVRPRPPR